MDVYNLEGAIKKVWGCEATLFVDISWSLLQRQKRIVIYYVKKLAFQFKFCLEDNKNTSVCFHY